MNHPLVNKSQPFPRLFSAILALSFVGCSNDDVDAPPADVQPERDVSAGIEPEPAVDNDQGTQPVVEPQVEPAAEWVPVNFPMVSLEMPGEPEQEGPFYRYNSDDVHYTAVIGFVPKVEGNTPKDDLDAHQERAVSGKTLQSEEYIDIEGAAAGKYAVYVDGDEAFAVKFFTVDKFLCQLIVVTNKDNLDSPDVNRFFSSVKVGR